jgi:HlyD family secretion protein
VQNVVTYDAVVDVANPDLKLKPGMTATVTFVYAQKDDVLRVPNAALRFRAPPGFGGDKGGSAPRGGGGIAGRAQAAEPAGPAPSAGAPRRPDAGEPRGRTVWVVRGERPEPVRIVPGISDGTVTEVVSGDLREGDAVVTDASGPSGGAQGGGLPGGGMRRGPF